MLGTGVRGGGRIDGGSCQLEDVGLAPMGQSDGVDARNGYKCLDVYDTFNRRIGISSTGCYGPFRFADLSSCRFTGTRRYYSG